MLDARAAAAVASQYMYAVQWAVGVTCQIIMPHPETCAARRLQPCAAAADPPTTRHARRIHRTARTERCWTAHRTAAIEPCCTGPNPPRVCAAVSASTDALRTA